MSASPATRLCAQLRASGLSISAVEIDCLLPLQYPADLRATARSWSVVGGERTRDVEFTAPLFRWRFEDGRRFQGRPPVRVLRRTWRSPFAGGESVTMDEPSMLSDLIVMIRRSFEEGADDDGEAVVPRPPLTADDAPGTISDPQ